MMDATSICNIMLPHTGPHYVTPPLVMLNSAKMHESLLSRDAFNLSSTPVVDIKSDRRKEHTDIADIKSGYLQNITMPIYEFIRPFFLLFF